MDSTLKKIWHFIWDDDSIWSWIVNVILAFLIIYFIVYPGLGFIFQTTHPIVAVVSGSMEHDGSFDEWWNQHEDFYSKINITKEQFKGFKFKNGFNKGDLMVLKGKSPEDIALGDVLVFNSIMPDPIIHRIVKINNLVFQTKGDHNSNSFANLGEFDVAVEEATGYEKYGKSSVAIARIPYLGWIKIAFVSNPFLFILGVVIFILISSNYTDIKKYITKK